MAAQAALLAAVVGGGMAYLTDDDITLVVDGVSRSVPASGRTVGDLLASQRIRVGERDLVIPSPSARLADDATVVVRFARPITLTVNGQPSTYWTTETTLSGALAVLGIRADQARTSVSRSARIGRQGMRLEVFPARTLTLRVGGRDRSVTSTAGTVAGLLREQRLVLDERHRLLDGRYRETLEPTDPLVDGRTVVVATITERRRTETRSLAFDTVRRSVDDLAEGRTTVIKAGRRGSAKVVYEVTLADGREIQRTTVSRTVVRTPVDRVLGVGTRASSGSTSTAASVGGTADSLNWAALAECESGGDPNIVSSNGLYHGLYQFSVSTWRSVGGSGLPSDASASEQTYRAKLLYE
jgi:uncharacterized protein YabE (DUF348 family)